MKICWVTTLYPPMLGGVGKLSKILCESLSRAGHKVVVHTLKYDETEPSKQVINGVKIIRHPFFSFFKYKYSPSMYRALMKEKAVDLIHAHHWGYYPLTCACEVARKRNIPLVMNAYYHPGEEKLNLSRAKRELFNRIENGKIFDTAKKVFAVSKVEAEQLKSIGARDICVLPLPIDTRIYTRKHIVKDQVLYCGTLSINKGANIFLQVAKRLHKRFPKLKIVMIGKCYIEINKKDYPYIIFKENLSEKNLIEEYNKSIVLLSPTRYESFGLVLAEAMSCKTPVISTRVGSLNETLGTAGMFSNFNNSDCVINKIVKLMNTVENNRVGKLCRSHIVNNFSKKVIVNVLLKHYEEVLND